MADGNKRHKTWFLSVCFSILTLSCSLSLCFSTGLFCLLKEQFPQKSKIHMIVLYQQLRCLCLFVTVQNWFWKVRWSFLFAVFVPTIQAAFSEFHHLRDVDILQKFWDVRVTKKVQITIPAISSVLIMIETQFVSSNHEVCHQIWRKWRHNFSRLRPTADLLPSYTLFTVFYEILQLA